MAYTNIWGGTVYARLIKQQPVCFWMSHLYCNYPNYCDCRKYFGQNISFNTLMELTKIIKTFTVDVKPPVEGF